MSPQEFHLVWEAKRPKRDDEYQGPLSERDLDDLWELMHDG